MRPATSTSISRPIRVLLAIPVGRASERATGGPNRYGTDREGDGLVSRPGLLSDGMELSMAVICPTRPELEVRDTADRLRRVGEDPQHAELTIATHDRAPGRGHRT